MLLLLGRDFFEKKLFRVRLQETNRFLFRPYRITLVKIFEERHRLYSN